MTSPPTAFPNGLDPAVHSAPAPRVQAMRLKNGCEGQGLFATEAIPAGERILRIEGKVTDAPSRYTIQIDHAAHLLPVDGESPDGHFDRYSWRFLNHRCDPNVMIRGVDVVAIHDIAPSEELTYHYSTTEYDMAEPFTCRCGSAHCRGEIRGFKHVPPAERARLEPWLAPYLRSVEQKEHSLPANPSAARIGPTP